MSISYTCSIAIGFLVTSIVVQSLGELIVVRHPPTNEGNTRILTCISEDDNSALIWNHRYNADNYETFQPKRPIPEKFTDCAIYGSSTCNATWENIKGWDVVDSVNHPMNPVLDYRWEGFKEFRFKNSIAEDDYQHVRQVNGATSTVIFSARGLRDIFIFLCENKDPTKGPCFWIIIGSLNGRQSEIWTCDRGTLESRPSNASGNCKDLKTTMQKTTVIDIYEWRTFRIEWKNKTKMIKVFKDTDAKPFLEGKTDNWHPVSHILIKSETYSHVRFHFYEYFSTEKKDAELSTSGFIQWNEDFCVELLVGLCPGCELRIGVIDRNNQPLTRKYFVGKGKNVDDAPLSWQLIILNETLRDIFPKIVQMKIQLRQYNDERRSQWAIDNFRTCRSGGVTRKSTITVHRAILGENPVSVEPPVWPQVNCQKLFYDGSAIVDSVSTTTIHNNINRFKQFSCGWMTSCDFSFENSIENFSVCNSIGCTCNPGFTGRDCASACPSGHYGYGCNEKCGRCCRGHCNAINGYCNQGCEDGNLLPPFCQKEFKSPIAVDVTDSTARVLQYVELGIGAEIRLIVKQEGEVSGTIHMQRGRSEGMSRYEGKISNLTANTRYTVKTMVRTKQNMEFSGPKIDFTTKSWEDHCFEVIPQKTNATVNVNQILQECIGFWNSNSWKLVYNIQISEGTNEGVILQPSSNILKLIPYTVYQLTVFGTNRHKWWKTEFRTLESAPGKVGNLRTPHVSDIEVTLKWDAPSQKNGIITKYRVSIKSKTFRGCEDLGRTSPQTEMAPEVNDTTAFFGSLHPYAVYSATVIAFTSEQGPEESLEFKTNEADIPTSVVTNLELTNDKTWLKWGEPEDCTTISAPIRPKRLILANISHSVQNWTTIMDKTFENNYIDLRNIGLNPYTMYRVRVHLVGRFGRVNETLYREIIWTTPPSAPPAPEDLQVFDTDPDENSISLRWKPPTTPNGEIESYKVSITKGNKRLRNWILEVSNNITMCKLWTNYVCLENLLLSPDFPTDSQVQLHVYVKNKNVEEPGSPSDFALVLDEYYNEAPGKPPNLTAINQGQGVVMLTWSHPSFSHTKITRFQIVVNITQSHLLKTPGPEYPMTKNHNVRQNHREYSIMLSLLPSTTYQVSIVAMDRRNSNSDRFEIQHSVEQSIGFSSEKYPEVKFHANSLCIEIPKIVNATQNTTLTVIIEGPSTCTPNQLQESLCKLSQRKAVTGWDAAVYQIGTNDTKSLRISAKEYQGVSSKCSLDPGESYTIVFAVTDWYSNKTITMLAFTPNTQILAWLAILPVLATSVVFYWLFVRRRYRKRVPKPSKRASYLEIIPLSSETTNTSNLKYLVTQMNSIPQSETWENRLSYDGYSLPKESDSCCVDIEYFEEYVKKAAANGLLHSQFMLFRKGSIKSCRYGSLPENLPKNRCSTQIAYDDTRVVLDEIPGDPHSDYINASYVKGYKKERAYIAAQGPMPDTVNDFWRMVWQEEVRVICMLTNVIESNEKKCEQYWPEVRTRAKYGNFLVLNTNTQVFADYTFRTFEMDCKQGKRKITQLHYTGWPTLGVPIYPQSLIAYLKKLKQTPAGNGPIVVHCSTGDNRTGTIILCDICLRQAAADKEIDITAVTTRMRDSRADMVGTLQQYILAHIIITGSMLSLATQIPCTKVLLKRIEEMKVQLPRDIQRLNDTAWREQTLLSLAPVEPPTAACSATESIEPLYTEPFASRSTQFHAVSVDGVQVKKQYLASRLPIPFIIADFWRFVTGRNIKLIIILQCSNPRNPNCCDLISNKSIAVPLALQVENKTSYRAEEYYTKEQLMVTNTSKKNTEIQSVTVLTCKGWVLGENGKPPTPLALVSLWIASKKILREEGQTLVLCHDGVTGCGLYLALSFLLERMAVDRECDVISAVRAVRRSKSKFVRSLEQFEYLYDAAVTYAECFQTYANFS